MRRLSTITAGLIALAALVAALTAISMRVAEVTNAGEPDPGIIFHIDCNATLAGIQDQCTYPTGTTQVDVDVVIENNTANALSLAGISFQLVSNPRPYFVPFTPGSCDTFGLNCSPDFDQSVFGANWSCSPPPPVPDTNQDGNGNTSESRLDCFTGSPPFASIAPAGLLRFGTTRFVVSSDVAPHLSLDQHTAAYDEDFNIAGICDTQLQEPQATCKGADILVGSLPLTPTPTSTHTSTPTATNTFTPQMTPSGTPTGAVTDIVALNGNVCLLGAIAIANVDTITAIRGCQEVWNQPILQRFLECVHLRPLCPSEPQENEIFQKVDRVDFDIIDRDMNQMHGGQVMIVVALVDGDYPVLFETETGVLLNGSGQQVGASALCFQSRNLDGLIGDPDCDADPNTVGDGAVATRIFVEGSTPPRGVFNVRATQAGTTRTIPIQVVGIPTTMTIESLDDRETIEAGAHARRFPGQPLDGDACDLVVRPPYGGAGSPRKTNLLIRVHDDEGTEVAGAVVFWTRDGNRSNPALFGRPDNPYGGPAALQHATWDLGSLGIGYVQTICGGQTAGHIDTVLIFDRIFSGQAPQTYTLPYTIDSTGTPPLPAPTPTACAGDEDCDGVLDGIDNCGSNVLSFNPLTILGPVSNPDQANNDRNFIDNSPPYASVADDRTRADSDVYGDACDTDDDNDGLFDVDEAGGQPCLAASGPTDPFKEDTDGDRFLDGAECAISTDPLDPTDKPPLTECGPPGQTLFGVLNARTAFCYFGIYFGGVDSDADSDLATDGTYDFCEIVSLNADRVVNVADMGMLAFGITRSLTLANIDLNRDGVVNPADQGSLAAVMSSHACPIRFN